MKRVDKNMGEHISFIKDMHFKSWDGRQNMFLQNRKQFIEDLQRDGYETFTNGNYITATRQDEVNTFFFTSHASGLTNYLIPANLKYRVQYFAFYDENKNCIYNVSYGKVREYCKGIKTGYRFAGGETKLPVPDSWAKEQVFNTRTIGYSTDNVNE